MPWHNKPLTDWLLIHNPNVIKHVLLVCSFDLREKLHERFIASAVFPAKNWINSHTNKICCTSITHLRSIRATISRKMLINNKFEAKNLTGNSTGNSRCHALASRDRKQLVVIPSILYLGPEWVNYEWGHVFLYIAFHIMSYYIPLQWIYGLLFMLTLNVQGPSHPGLTRSIWLMMPWLVALPSHQ